MKMRLQKDPLLLLVLVLVAATTMLLTMVVIMAASSTNTVVAAFTQHHHHRHHLFMKKYNKYGSTSFHSSFHHHFHHQSSKYPVPATSMSNSDSNNYNENDDDQSAMKESTFLRRRQTLTQMNQSQTKPKMARANQNQNQQQNQIRVKSIGSRILNPNHILFPSYFPYDDNCNSGDVNVNVNSTGTSNTATANNNNNNSNNNNAVDDIPLQRALVELSRSMEKIIEFESKYNYYQNDGWELDHDTMRELEYILGSSGSKKEMNIFHRYGGEGRENIFVADDDNNNYSMSETMINGENLRYGKGTTTDTKTASKQNSNDGNFFTIRVEQPLSHSVDPLCWLHANAKQSSSISQLLHNNKNRNSGDSDYYDDPTVIYIANAENTLEASVYGSSYTIQNLNDQKSKNERKSTSYSPWDVIQNLPMGSRVFGGGRFDKDLDDNLIGKEWKEFGKEIWVLPAVELRREKKNLSYWYTNKNDYHNDDKVDQNDDENIPHGKKVHDIENEQGQDQNLDRKEQPPLQENHATTITETMLSINLHFTSPLTLIESAKNVLVLLQKLSDNVSSPVPDTTLPPILSRTYNDNAQEVFENGVNAALDLFQGDTSSSLEEDASLKKVVLARRADLHFGTELSGLDLMMKFKFGGNIGGHLFYMNPGKNSGKEFLGCAPERLFQVRRQDKMVISEALAGTRPRGSTSKEDEELVRDLMFSQKDRSENMITGKLIQDAFDSLKDEGLLENTDNFEDSTGVDPIFFIRRLRHLQHLCQSVEGVIKSRDNTVDVVKSLLQKLHPTPAVCGFPALGARNFIRQFETSNFDRGMYAGPFGYIGKDCTDIVVAIRSGLLTKKKGGSMTTTLSIYAGAGVVPGSTVQGEWSETGYKLGVLSSFFAQSPMTLKSFPTNNEAWATSFVEELIRCGVTQYYICPGSRSTPLTAALSRAMRTHTGVIECISVHDERAAAFRALGYGRATGRTAAVVTSSGTAVANLYPAVVESSMDGIPILLLTADRPYESRDVGANQAIDQIKVFSDTYIRWFRDIAPPSDDVPISLALSDANHATTIAQDMLGPVHLNIQFRENLAPEGGPIRGDNRKDSITSFSPSRFTDVPGFESWSIHGKKWTQFYGVETQNDAAVIDVAKLIAQAKRGIIVVGNIRGTDATGGDMSRSTSTSAIISEFAKLIGFPIFAGAQSADLRFQSSAVVPYAEHILKHSSIKKNLKPDLIIQIGSTLVSTEIQDLISQSAQNDRRLAHVLVHKHRPTERADPSGTVTHKITSEVASFLPLVSQVLEAQGYSNGALGSRLAPLVYLGQEIGKHMPSIIHRATDKVRRDRERVWNEAKEDNTVTLSEPEIILGISEVMCSMNTQQRLDLFLSNSMPVRDSEFFLYPIHDYVESTQIGGNKCLGSVAVNRGASGIDGIISSATGFVEATSSPTTLVIGDLATLHDLNAFHHLSSRSKKSLPPLTTIIVNNDGGGIFSFLPIAKFGNDVGFEEFFGTPTNSFSFGKGAEAFGIPYEKVSDFEGFKRVYKQSLSKDCPTMVEAQVVGREENVQIHKEITAMTLEKIDNILSSEPHEETSLRLPAKFYRKDEIKRKLKEDVKEVDLKVQQSSKTLVLLHGWMGDKNEWDKAAISLIQDLPDNWSIISVDLPGHGESPSLHSWPKETLRDMLSIDSPIEEIMSLEDDRMSKDNLSVDKIADSVLHSLSKEYGLQNIDALAGYSLGGRIALSMKRLCSSDTFTGDRVISDNTQLILLGAYPGNFDSTTISSQTVSERLERIAKDKALSDRMLRMYESSLLTSKSSSATTSKIWARFLSKWYSNKTLWGDLQSRKRPEYQGMAQRRVQTLRKRAPDLAHVLEMCSPARSSYHDWKYISPDNTYFLAGELDKKYSIIGKEWANIAQSLRYIEVKDVGHALLVESPDEVSTIMTNILTQQKPPSNAVTIGIDSSDQQNRKVVHERNVLAIDNPTTHVKPGIFDMELFAIEMSESKNSKGVKGIGWGEQGKASNKVSERKGFIISIASDDGRFVGIGEVSPLDGVHSENLDDVKAQLQLIQDTISENPNVPFMECEKILALDGSMSNYIDLFVRSFSLEELQPSHLVPSVRSGLEMSLMSLASEAVRFPLPRALMLGSPSIVSNVLPINGLVTRGVSNVNEMLQDENQNSKSISYSSMKIKVGHLQPVEDAQSVISTQLSLNGVNVRADANRAWNESSAVDFVNELTILDNNIKETFEFLEEPLERQLDKNDHWKFSFQVDALEKWHIKTGIKYALDESLVEFVLDSKSDSFEVLTDKIRNYLIPANGCAALVLKPTVLGMELSLRLAKFAHSDLGIGAVFTSTFESGVGLAFTSFLATVSDANIKDHSLRYPHGISTFSVFNDDTLSPAFESYVKEDGVIKIAPLGRAIYGLSLDEIRDYFYTIEEVNQIEGRSSLSSTGDFQSMSSTSDTGREISVQVSLPLPFSDDIACSRFTDLPQQPRWSPWLNSVSYLGKGETEWTLNVRGVEFRWKAMSKFLDNPKGILWESTSGLKNKGRVEFIKVSDNSCLMKVTMTIITPRIIALVFKTTGEFVKEFVESKLLKWSLESFRDVVKADLALERGDAELGDALYGAVEGRSNAIEATLSYQSFEDIP